ncbi:acetyl-CoA hydrolase/transferase C-terminal domain-containing protein [Desulfobotulus mexicanus]|uniref:Acetyl-CoA hydrolase/transferase C-terminal domain-containing protein n=1 Tax=Desulfobotulus mexicanus TaxID=2586642 RepID=A0A5S5MCF9_9BACT|nr:acetyl-CoA hydrolase/transferase C-terminal domain-containing protein [Desulfobotulus mexicanus]TYT73416.1 hypothetical protein FIM25_15315 [Desulfobotulus mexicanus]
MTAMQTRFMADVEACVDTIIETVGKDVVLGMPLALGKSHHVTNGLYARAKKDPEMKLTILTALALEKPSPSSELERRMLEPIVARIWEGVPDFDYMKDYRNGKMPENVTVREFFYKAGSYMNVPAAQQEYISSNYTHVVRDLEVNAINVYCHIVARGEENGQLVFSDSCNSDLGQDIIDYMEKSKAAGRRVMHVAHVNRHLPFMYGDAVNTPDVFDIVLEGEEMHTPLFSVPKASVAVADHAIGLHVSSLVKDGGTLQIGIGALGDAIADSLILRHEKNDVYRSLLADAGIEEHYGDLVDSIGGRKPFEEGLYGATEMLVEAFMYLYKAGILKRKVYQNENLQRFVNDGSLKEVVRPEALAMLLSEKPFYPMLMKEDFDILQYYGLFQEGLVYDDFQIKDRAGNFWTADLRDENYRKELAGALCGGSLKNGVLLHAGFFIGSNDFYEGLRTMDADERRLFSMTGVDVVNQLYGNERLRALQRKDARFVNTGMKLSLLGNVCSDALEDGRVVSGVGGQYNFVAMAHALKDARLIMMLRSTGFRGGQTVSNVVFNYGHTTIPRHLRDIVVTEYGIADLRGRSDREIISRVLAVTDSRFQEGLLKKAKDAGKIPQHYIIPEAFRNNTPQRLNALAAKYKNQAVFAPFPFGSEFTREEQVLGRSLRGLKQNIARKKWATIGGILGGLFRPAPESAHPFLQRMGLDQPSNFKEKLLRSVVTHALISSGSLDAAVSRQETVSEKAMKPAAARVTVR